jgi:broad specificity phosphatase PhoE
VTQVRLVLARHGRTVANVGHVLDSRPPGSPLDELGAAQARDLAARLASWPVRAVHASRAVRAQQTAAPLAAAHDLPVEVLDGVQEVFLGDLEGRSDAAALAAFDEVYAAWWRGDLDARVPGGESAAEVRARIVPVLEQLVAEPAAGDVVLVSHGAAIRLASAALLGDTAETFYVPNAGLVVLRPDPTGWVLESWDQGRPVRGDVTAGGTPFDDGPTASRRSG